MKFSFPPAELNAPMRVATTRIRFTQRISAEFGFLAPAFRQNSGHSEAGHGVEGILILCTLIAVLRQPDSANLDRVLISSGRVDCGGRPQTALKSSACFGASYQREVRVLVILPVESKLTRCSPHAALPLLQCE